MYQFQNNDLFFQIISRQFLWVSQRYNIYELGLTHNGRFFVSACNFYCPNKYDFYEKMFLSVEKASKLMRLLKPRIFKIALNAEYLIILEDRPKEAAFMSLINSPNYSKHL